MSTPGVPGIPGGAPQSPGTSSGAPIETIPPSVHAYDRQQIPGTPRNIVPDAFGFLQAENLQNNDTVSVPVGKHIDIGNTNGDERSSAESATNNIELDDEAVSKAHASIKLTPEGYIIVRDHKSANEIKFVYSDGTCAAVGENWGLAEENIILPPNTTIMIGRTCLKAAVTERGLTITKVDSKPIIDQRNVAKANVCARLISDFSIGLQLPPSDPARAIETLINHVRQYPLLANQMITKLNQYGYIALRSTQGAQRTPVDNFNFIIRNLVTLQNETALQKLPGVSWKENDRMLTRNKIETELIDTNPYFDIVVGKTTGSNHSSRQDAEKFVSHTDGRVDAIIIDGSGGQGGTERSIQKSAHKMAETVEGYLEDKLKPAHQACIEGIRQADQNAIAANDAYATGLAYRVTPRPGGKSALVEGANAGDPFIAVQDLYRNLPHNRLVEFDTTNQRTTTGKPLKPGPVMVINRIHHLADRLRETDQISSKQVEAHPGSSNPYRVIGDKTRKGPLEVEPFSVEIFPGQILLGGSDGGRIADYIAYWENTGDRDLEWCGEIRNLLQAFGTYQKGEEAIAEIINILRRQPPSGPGEKDDVTFTAMRFKQQK